MDIIIPNTPKYSDAELDRAFVAEIKNSLELEKATEESRYKQAAKEAHQLKGTIHPTLGRPIATIPAREFFRLVKKYGHETVHSKDFLKYYNKKFPELSPNKI
jgi:hypothetical protein